MKKERAGKEGGEGGGGKEGRGEKGCCEEGHPTSREGPKKAARLRRRISGLSRGQHRPGY